jgi:hypothetical protein
MCRLSLQQLIGFSVCVDKIKFILLSRIFCGIKVSKKISLSILLVGCITSEGEGYVSGFYFIRLEAQTREKFFHLLSLHRYTS